MTKPTYSELETRVSELEAECKRLSCVDEAQDELEAENLRVRGLLQRQWVPIESAPKTGEHILVAVFDGGVGFGTCGGKKQAWAGVVHYWEPDEPGWYMSTANGDIRVEPTHWQPIVPQSSSLVSEGAESADIGKLDSADKAVPSCSIVGKTWHSELYESGVEMGKVNRVDIGCEKDSSHRWSGDACFDCGSRVVAKYTRPDGSIEIKPVSTFRQSPVPVQVGAESAHSGKQNTADKSELLPTQLPKEK